MWGPTLAHAGPAAIHLNWTGPNQLEVRMDRPALRWQLGDVTDPAAPGDQRPPCPPAVVDVAPRGLVTLHEWAVRGLGLGAVSMAGTSPTGQQLVAVMRRMFWVDHATAQLDGGDLGAPGVLDRCPTIGGWPLPRRGVFAIGEAHATIGDPDEYQRLRRDALGRAGGPG